MAASIASATPVLPDVGSTMVPPGRRSPRRSASSIMARAMRSLTLPPGLNHSSLAKIRADPREYRASSTRGVWPMAPASCCGEETAVLEDIEVIRTKNSKKKAPARPGLEHPSNEVSVSLLGTPRRVALAAVDRLPIGGIERHLSLFPAAVAGDDVEGPLAAFARRGLALVAAGLAALGLVGETLARVELLIICREQESAATVDASQILVRALLHHESYRSPGSLPFRDLLGPVFEKKLKLELANRHAATASAGSL